MSHPRPATVAEAANTSGGPLSDRHRPSGTQFPPAPRGHRNRATWWVARSLVMLVLAGAVAFGVLLFVTPSASEAVALVKAQATKHGTPYPGPNPPQRFTEALVATEDQRFYSPFDPGVDPFAVGRAVLGQMLAWGDEGGSTIDQQLAKLLYTPRRHSLSVKLERMVLALKLNFTYTKPEILAMYAEIVYFGNGYYGLEAASCGYFGRQPADLTWAQAAMLAGVLNAPSLYNPRIHPSLAQQRQAHVFRRLVAVGALSEAQAKAALSQPLDVVPAALRAVRSSCR